MAKLGRDAGSDFIRDVFSGQLLNSLFPRPLCEGLNVAFFDSGAASQSLGTNSVASFITAEPPSAPPLIDPQQLRQFERFRDVPPESLDQFLAAANVIDIGDQKEVVIPKGKMHVLLEGQVRCVLSDAAGKPIELGRSLPGATYGELAALLNDRAHDNNVTLVTVGAVRMLEAPMQRYIDLLRSDQSGTAMVAALTESAARLDTMDRFASRAIDQASDPSQVRGTTRGERAADFLNERIGSWKFILGAAATTGIYVVINTVGAYLGFPMWDRYPFIFLNLVTSLASAFYGPAILKSQNRQNQIDRIANHFARMKLILIEGLIRRQGRDQRKRMAKLEAGMEELLKRTSPPPDGPE